MIRIAHIVNPFNASETSDLFTAQPITFESMRRSKEQAKGLAEITLLSAQFPEDENMVPEGFVQTPNLTRSVLDHGTFEKPMKLPFIHDILQRMYDSSEAEYLIYTNVDIGVYPDFYTKVVGYIEQGLDAFIINRRRISDRYKNVDQLPEIYQDFGKKHPGFDCFVFHRDLFPKMVLKEICIGVPFIGITTAQNLFALSKNFKLFDRENLTFHIGMDVFPGRASKDFFRYNQKQFWLAMKSELSVHLDTRKFPYQNLIYPIRIIRWGLQPSIPIRLVLKLEWRRFKNYFRRSK